MASGGQRIVPTGQGGSIMVARPQGQQAQMIPGGQIVRTSSGILLNPQRPVNPIQPQVIRPGIQNVSRMDSIDYCKINNRVGSEDDLSDLTIILPKYSV